MTEARFNGFLESCWERGAEGRPITEEQFVEAMARPMDDSGRLIPLMLGKLQVGWVRE